MESNIWFPYDRDPPVVSMKVNSGTRIGLAFLIIVAGLPALAFELVFVNGSPQVYSQPHDLVLSPTTLPLPRHVRSSSSRIERAVARQWLDNYRKHEKVQAWLARHPRWIPFTPITRSKALRQADRDDGSMHGVLYVADNNANRIAVLDPVHTRAARHVRRGRGRRAARRGI